jgi:two-component system, LytTR family, response regulator
MIKAIIIDNEPGVRRVLSLMLQQHCPDVVVAAEAESVQDAYEAIIHYQPDLVFLDIRMEDGTGFDLLQRFQNVDFHIIFITAFEEYAIKAFKFSAVDYLLKPVELPELLSALERLRSIMSPVQDHRVRNLLLNLQTSRQDEKKLVLRTHEKFHFVKVSDIVFCKCDGNYTTFFLQNENHIMVSRSLKEYDEMLADYGFFRPHKSYLINLAHVTGFEKSEGGFIIMKEDLRVPISYRKKDDFLRIVEGM